MPQPVLVEQQLIHERMMSVSAREQACSVRLNKLLLEKLGHMDDLLTGRVRVKLTEAEAT